MNYSSSLANPYPDPLPLSGTEVPTATLGEGDEKREIKHGDTVHVISSNSSHTNNRHEMARINNTITRELLIKMDEKMRRIVI
jgi:hypothetical protein